MEAMKKYIDVTREVRQDIMAAFNVTGKVTRQSASVYMPSRKVAL